MSKRKPAAKRKGLGAGIIAFGAVFALFSLIFRPHTPGAFALAFALSLFGGAVVRVMAQGLDLSTPSRESESLQKVQGQTGDPEVDALLEKGREMIAQIREENDRIPDASLSEKLEKLENLEDELQSFVRNTEWMLEGFFQDLPSRSRQDYIRTYAGYRRTIGEAMQQQKDAEDEGAVWEEGTIDLDTISFDFPVNISLVPVSDPKSHCLVLAEQMTFESLSSFLYLDLYKGMAAGNLPRRCAYCRRWFLAMGGYNTLFCSRVVPGTGGKTCRKIGAHAREKEKQRTETAAREYNRIYNRLKARKRRGRLSTDEWNRKVAQAQALKDTFAVGMITREEYVQKLNAL